MSESFEGLDSDDASPAVTINGEKATSIRFERKGSEPDRSVNLTFANGSEVIETVRDIKDIDDVYGLVGLMNATRINRGPRDTGVLEGRSLRSHETVLFRGGGAAIEPGPWTGGRTEWFDRDPANAVPYPTGTTMINGKEATSVAYEREESPDRYSLTFKEGRRHVAKVRFAGEHELAAALGKMNADVIQASEKGRLVGKSLLFHEGIGVELPSKRKGRSTGASFSTDREPASEIASDAPPFLPSTNGGQAEPETDPPLDAEDVNSVEPVVEAELEPGRSPQVNAAPEIETEGIRPATAPVGQASTDEELARRIQVIEEVRGQFRVNGGVYRFKDGTRAVAFTDRGGRLTSASNDARAARAVAAMADGKGWTSIQVSGHAEFRREAWLEARSRGLSVRGYKPTEQDLAELDERGAKREPNRVNPDAREPIADTERDTESQSHASNPVKPSGPRSKSRNDSLNGELIDHGPAPYKDDPDASDSYRVRVQTDTGPQDAWGVDLNRAIAKSGAEPGDVISLTRGGSETVTVDSKVRDEAGRVVGTERIEANRNQWMVTVAERRKVLDAVASAYVDKHAGSDQARERLNAAMQQSLNERQAEGSLPAVPVYDHRAPSRARDNRLQATQQSAERAPERAR